MNRSCAPTRMAFTLVELMAVIVIMGLMLGIAITSYQRINKSSSVGIAASQIVSTLEYARQAAIARNTYAGVILGSNYYQALVRDPYLNASIWSNAYVHLPGNEDRRAVPPGVQLWFRAGFPVLPVAQYAYRKETESGSFGYMSTNGLMRTNYLFQLSNLGGNQYCILFDAFGLATATATVMVSQTDRAGTFSTNTWTQYNYAQIIVEKDSRHIRVVRP